MNEPENLAVTAALDEYAESLRAERASADLDSRINAAIESWAAEHRSRSVWRKPLPWVVAAASVAVVAGGVALLTYAKKSSGSDSALSKLVVTPTPSVSPLSTGGQVSLFPAEGAVFRVKANLASAVLKTSGEPTDGERQYWVDVRIANDGTMRIMQVLPAEHGRIVPRE